MCECLTQHFIIKVLQAQMHQINIIITDDAVEASEAYTQYFLFGIA